MATAEAKRRRHHSPPASTAGGDSSTPTPAAPADSSSPSLDLIPDIARRLTSLEDFFSLRASCRAYRALLPASRRLLASQSPLLLVSLYPSFAEALFHPRLRRLHRFRLPWGHHLPPSRYTLLYAHGFLVTATTAANNYPPRLLLLRLFTGEQLRLPRVFAPFSRVILTADLLVVIFLPGRATVQHCRPGDALWRMASAPAPHVFDDLISVNGTLYALVGLRLATLELSESSLELSFLGGEHDDANRPEGDRFMLGECGGEVLLISVEHEERVVYRVFRWVSEKRKWEMITNLGGRSLFLGLDGFAACVDQDHPGWVHRRSIVGSTCSGSNWPSLTPRRPLPIQSKPPQQSSRPRRTHTRAHTMQHLALLRPLIHPSPLPAASPLAARCRSGRGRGRGVRWRCATGEGAGGGEAGEEGLGKREAASWLSSAVGEKVDELLLREENRALVEGVEAAERRVERARAALADIERQEAAARLASEEVRRLERRRDEVFNWLNRKKHSNVEYCTINENKAMEEKEDSLRASVTEQDTEALLLRDVLINGILAIGTLGHNVNSLCPESCIEQDEPIIMCDEKVEEEKCEEEKAEAKQDTPVTAPSEPASALEPAKMHSSSMKEDNFMCFVKEEILMHGMEVEDVPNIQEQPLLMLEKVEKVRTTLADLFAAEAFSSSDTEDKCCPKIVIVAGASTSKPTSCMEKMHHKKPTKPTSKPLKATRKLSRVMRKMLGKKIHPVQLNGRSNAEGPLN
uniref:Protein TILLER ANGLE CONTROL 1 n=1 Tax=Oryza meridionalis TaxID=40149 RepID=A0A0E0EU37_9ORYZ